jgi:hypothetical protein
MDVMFVYARSLNQPIGEDNWKNVSDLLVDMFKMFDTAKNS